MLFRGCSTRILWPAVWALQWMPGPRVKLATSMMFWFQTFAYHLHLLCRWHFLRLRVVFSCRCVYDTFSTFCMQPSTANALGSSGNQASTKSIGINLYNQWTFFWHEKCSDSFGTETIQICHYDSVPAPLKASLDIGKFCGKLTWYNAWINAKVPNAQELAARSPREPFIYIDFLFANFCMKIEAVWNHVVLTKERFNCSAESGTTHLPATAQ